MNFNEQTMNFNEEVLQHPNLVLVDFYAPWCGPCNKLTPVLEALVQKNGDKVKMIKVNIDENQGLAGQYNVCAIPQISFFRNGQEVKKIVGLTNATVLQNAVDTL